MFGFTFGGADPHNSVANRAIKVLLGTHLHTLMPKIRQRIIQGVESQLGEAHTNSDGQYSVSVVDCIVILSLPYSYLE